MIDRLVDRAMGGVKKKVRFDFSTDQNKYEVVLFYPVAANWFLQAWQSVHKRFPDLRGKTVPNTFGVPDRLLGGVHKKARKTMEKVLADLRKEERMRDFEVLSSFVEKAWCEKQGKDFVFCVKLTGVCKGEKPDGS